MFVPKEASRPNLNIVAVLETLLIVSYTARVYAMAV